MPVIYMRHSIHGTKVAFSEQEAQYDENHGWSRFDINEQSNVESEPQEDQPVNSMVVKRGRKQKSQ